jgi:hypothetical protein
MMRFRPVLFLIGALAAAWPHQAAAEEAAAQPPAAEEAAAPQAPAAKKPDDPDRDINFAQPDFTLVALPTTLRMPKFKSEFRLTHRFLRPLGEGDFGDLASDAFGLDSGAQIGLEYRFGFWSGLQGGIHRTSDKTIEFFSEYNVLQQAKGKNSPVGLSALASIDGTNNFQDSYSPALGVAISREFGKHGAVYFEPIWVNNSNPKPSALVDNNDTFIYGVGGRARVLSTVYVVAEIMPRSGYKPGVNQASFGVEKRLGGHVFQLNFSNAFGTTMGQIARGGISNSDWYLGFNLSRKFY